MHATNRVAAVSLGAVIGVALVVGVPYWIDGHVDSVWDEDYRIVAQDDEQTTLRLWGNKPWWRDLPLRTRPALGDDGRPLLDGNGNPKREIVPPAGWAVSADGYRRKVDVAGVEDNRPKDYPPGRADFGAWTFRSPRDSAPPVVAYEIEIFQDGWFGPRSEILGAFPVR